MKKLLVFFLLNSLFATPLLKAQKATLADDAITVADVEKVFGKGFTSEKPSKIGEIQTFRFSNKNITIHISAQPAHGMKVEEYNKMMSPKTVTWKPIPNDADGAQTEIRDDQKDDLASTPAIAYVRKNYYVYLKVLGVYYSDKKTMPTQRDEMRKKLTQLKRIPQ